MFPNVALLAAPLPLERRTAYRISLGDFFGLCLQRFTFAYERSCIRHRRPGHGRSSADHCGSAERMERPALTVTCSWTAERRGYSGAEPVEQVLSVGRACGCGDSNVPIQGLLGGSKGDDLVGLCRNAECPRFDPRDHPPSLNPFRALQRVPTGVNRDSRAADGASLTH